MNSILLWRRSYTTVGVAQASRMGGSTENPEMSMNDNILRGVVAGFAATAALSVLMVMKSALGIMPQLDVIAMLGGMMGGATALAWVAHFMIGSVIWGGIFAVFQERLPGRSFWQRGIALGVGAWVLMMLFVMPMAGAGLFGLGLGISAPLMTLMLHVIFGAILGVVYAALQGGEDPLHAR